MTSFESIDANTLKLETKIALDALNAGIEALISRNVHSKELEPLANLSRQAVEAFEALPNYEVGD